MFKTYNLLSYSLVTNYLHSFHMQIPSRRFKVTNYLHSFHMQIPSRRFAFKLSPAVVEALWVWFLR